MSKSVLVMDTPKYCALYCRKLDRRGEVDE